MTTADEVNGHHSFDHLEFCFFFIK